MLRRLVVGFLATIGFCVLMIFAIGIGFWYWAEPATPRLASGTVLTLDLSQALPDAPADHGLSQLLFPTPMSLAEAVNALERAGDDPRVAGLVARIGDSSMGLGEVQELRDAIAAFRAKGKRAVAYADTFGELSSGMRSYYLASAFDEIWLQPLGTVGLVGVRAELQFFRGTLDLLGVTPDFSHREEYKDAANTVTETQMTAPEREELQAVLQSVYDQIIEGIAIGRKIEPGAVKALVDRAPLLLDEAVKAHLVDHIGGRDDAIAALRGTDKLVGLDRYLQIVGAPHQSGPTIALIYGTGLMARGKGGGNPLTNDNIMSADEVTRAFRLAEADKAVRAILFRIDSPGGSAVAAETIWASVKRARDAGKPVVVSMGDVAGSGGYYIAAPAAKIVAEPATLTGSIGVIAGKLVFGGLLKKIGGNSDSIQIGANAGIFSIMNGFSPSERERLEAVLDDIYNTFKSRVAEGRKLDANAVEAVAKGRVWSGADAKERGLVDALGGMTTALGLAKEQAGIRPDQDVNLKLYPPPKSNLDRLIARLGGNNGNDEDSVVTTRLRAVLQLVEQRLGLAAPPGTLTMRPLSVE